VHGEGEKRPEAGRTEETRERAGKFNADRVKQEDLASARGGAEVDD